MNHAMIDIETLGTTPGSTILTIGAVIFEPYSGDFGSEFYERIDRGNSKSLGFTEDPDTISWWLQQSESAFQEAMSGDTPICIALARLREFLQDNPAECTWSHGFMDIALLEASYRRFHIKDPWTYREVRDTRTVYDLADINMRDFADPSDTHHNALSDAKVQARALIAAYRKLGLSGSPEAHCPHAGDLSSYGGAA